MPSVPIYSLQKIIDERNAEPSLSFLYTLFFIIFIICYHNTFQASWHLDDVQNILQNNPLHITDLGNKSLKQTFFAYPGQVGKMLRPVSNFSFALNWFFGQDNVIGYHIVNIIIHFLAAVFLHKSCLLILSTRRLNDKYQNSKFFIAGLAALFWAVNPIQTSAVTYIVQRMASLAALFYIIAIWCYLKARLASGGAQRFFLYAGLATAYVMAIGSKENAIILPVSIFLLEIIFFQDGKIISKKTVLFLLISTSLIFSFTLLLGGGLHFFTNIFQSSPERSFTVWQRLLTQPRIILFYISLILYPSPLRLSIDHDIQLSTSLVSPPATLAALLVLIGLAASAIGLRKKQSLFSFAILFFLVNHLVESTMLNLELIFEHRNYLPSFFFFLPVAALVHTALETYRQRKIMFFIIWTGTIGVIILFSIATILRNMVWQTDTRLWTDALAKAPQSSRPYINLAYNLQYEGDYQRAFELYRASLDKYSPTPWKDRARANNGMGNIMMLIGNYKQAVIFFRESAEISKEQPNSMHYDALFQKSTALFMSGELDQSFLISQELVKKNEENGRYAQYHAEMLMHSSKNEEELAILRKTFAVSSFQSIEYRMALLDLSLLHGRINMHDKANLYLRLASAADAPTVPMLLCLLEHSIRADKKMQADQAFKQLLEKFTWPVLMTILERPHIDQPLLPVSYPILKQYAENWLSEQEKIYHEQQTSVP